LFISRAVSAPLLSQFAAQVRRPRQAEAHDAAFRWRGGVITTDGPFADTKEQVGGFYLLEASG